MPGSIRIVIGMSILFGTAGGLELDTMSLAEALMWAIVGAGIGLSGAQAANRFEEENYGKKV